MSQFRWLILIPLLALAWFAPRIGDRWFGTIERISSRFAARKGTVIIAIALTAILTRLALLWFIPVPVPAVHDEFSQLLAGDTFAHGRLTNLTHPMWIFLDTFYVLQHPTYASIFPPAQGAVLALGQVLGHPWIGVLLSMAAMCAAITWMLQGWFPARWALLGAVLVLLKIHLCSYWLDSYWGGAVPALGGALVMGALPRIVHYQRARDAVLMGIGAGLLANSRPFEGFLFCIPVAVALVAWLASQRSPKLRTTWPSVIFPVLCVLGFTLAFVGYYNWRVTGSALVIPHELYDRQYINFRVFIWQAEPPPLKYSNPQFEDFFNTWVRHEFRVSWNSVWEKCFAWWQFFLGIALWIPLAALPWVLRDRRIRLLLIQFLWCGLGLLAVFALLPHYAAPLTATVFALLVQGMRHLRQWKPKGRPVGVFLTRLVVVMALARLFIYIGEAARQPSVDSWSSYRAQIVKQLEASPEKHLVLVEYAAKHNPNHEWVYNAADIDHSKVVWAREIPGRDPKPLLDYFHDRKVWVVEADAVPARLQPYSAAAGLEGTASPPR